jgi:fatty-acyl-CoA synthase
MPSSTWTLASVFAQRAREHADRALVVAGGRTLSYAQVEARAGAMAAALSELGIGAGDRIAINLPNCAEWIVALLASAKLGAVVVPVNPRLNHHERKYQLRHAEVSVVFTVERYGGVDYLQLFEEVIAELPDLQYLVTIGGEDLWYDDRIFQFEDLLSKGEGSTVAPPDSLHDGVDLALLYTSGTMGKPKGVRLGHRAVVETALRTGQAIEMDPADRVLVSVPLFAIFGFGVAVGHHGRGRDARAAGGVRRGRGAGPHRAGARDGAARRADDVPPAHARAGVRSRPARPSCAPASSAAARYRRT